MGSKKKNGITAAAWLPVIVKQGLYRPVLTVSASTDDIENRSFNDRGGEVDI